ncbi:4109_t:CDS:1 [Scutellospora calospora]|uniref:4109_t:CDS:1 n=1 Tax=Scutellospora calospora TaxID=85575 RepID=A0ACA9MG00_9GLOM|nr:4109_t:CDS:1 [Scutellospora calospora]
MSSSSSRSSSIISKTSNSSSDDGFSQELTAKLQYLKEQGEGIGSRDLNNQSTMPNELTSSSNKDEVYTSNYQISQHDTLVYGSSYQKLHPPPPLDSNILSETSGDEILSTAEFDAIFASFSAIAGEPDECECDCFSSASTDDKCSFLDDDKLSQALDSISI